MDDGAIVYRLSSIVSRTSNGLPKSCTSVLTSAYLPATSGITFRILFHSIMPPSRFTYLWIYDT
jgi:hypothetical protein